MKRQGYRYLTPAQQAELVRRYIAGEQGRALAAEFGVHQTYPTKLVRRHAGDQYLKLDPAVRRRMMIAAENRRQR